MSPAMVLENRNRDETAHQTRILVVEDERIVALDLTMTLKRLGYRADDSVATGEEAVDVALRIRPDLVLMDIRLAGKMDGVAAGEAIVNAIDAPIIYLTAHSDSETLKRVESSRPYSYLLKPFRADDLRCAIEVTLSRHAADVALRNQERWLRTTLNAIHDGIVSADAAETIQYLNPVAETMTGRTSAQALGRKLSEIVRLLDEATGADLEIDSNITRDAELGLKSFDGAMRSVESSHADIRNHEGVRLGHVVVLQDVSKCRAAMKEVARLNSHLEKTVIERTRALEAVNRELDAFSYSLAHDLRSPLRAIDGYAQSLIEDRRNILDDASINTLTLVRSTAQRTSRLIADLLALAHLTQREPELMELDLSAIAAEIVAELKAIDKGKTEFVVQPHMRVFGDKALVQVVVTNLLNNACKFSAGKAEPKIEFGMQQDLQHDVFFVRDNGVGFEMKEAGRILGAFQRLHGEQFSGNGIGLALVDRALKRMRGRIWMESEPQKGATFYFAFDKHGHPNSATEV